MEPVGLVRGLKLPEMTPNWGNTNIYSTTTQVFIATEKVLLFLSPYSRGVELHDLWCPFQPILCFSEKKKYSFHFNPLKVCYGTTDHTQIVNMGCCIFNWCCFVLCLNLFHFTSDREKGKILLQFHTIQPIINTINKLPLLLHVLFATSGIFLPPPFSAPVCWPIRKK